MVSSAAMQRLFLYHLWACVPFALAWAIAPGVFGVAHDPGEIQALRLVALLALLYLAVRSWVVLHRPQWGWQYVWPLADVVLISVALCLKAAPESSWLSLLYLLPVTEAAATLDLRWALLVGGLAAAAYLLACGASGIDGALARDARWHPALPGCHLHTAGLRLGPAQPRPRARRAAGGRSALPGRPGRR